MIVARSIDTTPSDQRRYITSSEFIPSDMMLPNMKFLLLDSWYLKETYDCLSESRSVN